MYIKYSKNTHANPAEYLMYIICAGALAAQRLLENIELIRKWRKMDTSTILLYVVFGMTDYRDVTIHWTIDVLQLTIHWTTDVLQ